MRVGTFARLAPLLATLIATLIVAAPDDAGAQVVAPSALRITSAPAAPALHLRAAPGFTSRRPLAGAMLGASVGALVGGWIGGHLSSQGCESGNPDACLGKAFPGFIGGFAVGHTLGAPLGAHFTNRRRGDLTRSLLVSTALLAAEVLAIRGLVEDGRTAHEGAVIGIAIATPVLQILTSAHFEHRTTR